jgi:hypothetical protein
MMGRQLTTVLRRAASWPVPHPHSWPVPLDGADEVRRRASAATGSPRAADAVVAAWEALPPMQRAAVLDPVGRLARVGRQVDETTCGSAVLAMLGATGDPSLAIWLVTGALPVGAPTPPEMIGAPQGALALLAGAPAERRSAALQRVLKRRSTERALLGLPWPGMFGTPPWGAARVARFPGVAYHHEPLDDTDRADLSGILDAVAEAAEAGIPVPLYSGGDTARGLRTAVPRHVVLVVGSGSRGLRVFEPGAGRVLTVSKAALLAGDRPRAALGGWQHLTWVLQPHPA